MIHVNIRWHDLVNVENIRLPWIIPYCIPPNYVNACNNMIPFCVKFALLVEYLT